MTFDGFWTTSACITIVYHFCSSEDKKKEIYITGNALLSLGGAVNCCLSLVTIYLIVSERPASLSTPISIGSGFHLSRCRCHVTDNPDVVGKDRGCSRATSTTGK